jgi:hypothetical protein
MKEKSSCTINNPALVVPCETWTSSPDKCKANACLDPRTMAVRGRCFMAQTSAGPRCSCCDKSPVRGVCISFALRVRYFCFEKHHSFVGECGTSCGPDHLFKNDHIHFRGAKSWQFLRLPRVTKLFLFFNPHRRAARPGRSSTRTSARATPSNARIGRVWRHSSAVLLALFRKLTHARAHGCCAPIRLAQFTSHETPNYILILLSSANQDAGPVHAQPVQVRPGDGHNERQVRVERVDAHIPGRVLVLPDQPMPAWAGAGPPQLPLRLPVCFCLGRAATWAGGQRGLLGGRSLAC